MKIAEKVGIICDKLKKIEGLLGIVSETLKRKNCRKISISSTPFHRDALQMFAKRKIASLMCYRNIADRNIVDISHA